MFMMAHRLGKFYNSMETFQQLYCKICPNYDTMPHKQIVLLKVKGACYSLHDTRKNTCRYVRNKITLKARQMRKAKRESQHAKD